MEVDWNNRPFELDGTLSLLVIVASFEERFAIRLVPDSPRFSVQARYFSLGKSAGGLGIFSVYRTNGTQSRVVMARLFVPEEQFLYQRKLDQALAP